MTGGTAGAAMRRVGMVVVVVLGMLSTLLMPATAATQHDVREALKPVRHATAGYHDVAAAEADGYVEFLECFDSVDGGMGQHYVDVAALDDEVEAAHPEAMVYEIRKDGSLRLVAVEYIVPDSPEVAADVPELFGHSFHLNESLGVWVLHAWIWAPNPSGMFVDYNPRIHPCPGG